MPGFDRTGPMGQGPMSGRGMGYCGAGTSAGTGGAVYGRGRGGMPRGGGRGFGFGGGRGRGFGFGGGARWGNAPAQQAPGNEATWLRSRADSLEAELQDIKARLSELDRNS